MLKENLTVIHVNELFEIAEQNELQADEVLLESIKAVETGNFCRVVALATPILDRLAGAWFLGAKTKAIIKNVILATNAFCALQLAKNEGE